MLVYRWVCLMFVGDVLLAYAHHKFANIYNMYNTLLTEDACRGPSRKVETWEGGVLFFYFCTPPFLPHECIAIFKLKQNKTQKLTNKQKPNHRGNYCLKRWRVCFKPYSDLRLEPLGEHGCSFAYLIPKTGRTIANSSSGGLTHSGNHSGGLTHSGNHSPHWLHGFTHSSWVKSFPSQHSVPGGSIYQLWIILPSVVGQQIGCCCKN